MLFLTMTSGCVAIDCLYKLRIPLRDVTALILQDAGLPALIAVFILLGHWAREK
jgi:hypothetical protein